MAPSPLLAVDLLLEPGPRLAARAVEVNERLFLNGGGGFRFGPSRLPHLTLVQAYIPSESLPALRAALDAAFASPPGLARLKVIGYETGRFGSLCVLSYAVTRTAALMALHRRAAAVLTPFTAAGGGPAAFATDAGETAGAAIVDYVEHFAAKASGKAFAPHITLGLGPEPEVSALAAEPLSALTELPAALTLRRLGDFGTARDLLWSAPSR